MSFASEPTFHSFETDWYGDRYFFQTASLWRKTHLEVTYIRDLNTYVYRYFSWKGLWFVQKSGTELSFHDETIPFWIRKIFFLFSTN